MLRKFRKKEELYIDSVFLQTMLMRYITNARVKLKSGDLLVSFSGVGFRADRIALQNNKQFNQFLENNKIKVVYDDTEITFSIM